MPPKVRHFLQRTPLSHELTTLGFVVVFVLLLGAAWYGYTRVTTLTERVNDLAARSTDLNSRLNDAIDVLINALQKEQQAVDSKLGGVQDTVGSITDTVSDLQKLSQTDPELLAKYSKVFFLSENYAPARLDTVPSHYAYNDSKQLQLIPEVLPFLEDMIDAAKDDGDDLYVDSAYRSFNTQESLKEQYKLVYGAGTANSFSADQGYSEHQLGTTVDLITTGTGGALLMDSSPAFAWLEKNAYRFGFVLSYPKNNGYYIYEPWHWRFVGVKLATHLHRTNSYFYSMDQRDIDTYLIHLFD